MAPPASKHRFFEVRGIVPVSQMGVDNVDTACYPKGKIAWTIQLLPSNPVRQYPYTSVPIEAVQTEKIFYAKLSI
jgi:hypothetical protein